MSAAADLAASASAALPGGGRGRTATAFAPGRCTVVGEHVDYADGVVVCIAVHLGIAVAVRASGDGVWRLRSGGRVVERGDPSPCGDAGDLPFATALALRLAGFEVPALEIGVAATLREGAGLSSSAALCCATAVAVLRLLGVRLPAAALCDVALRAERDIAGVPCGPLDQRAVVLAPAGGALVLDCRDGGAGTVPWLDGYVLAACHTGDAHDVGGEGYRTRRSQADAALAAIAAGQVGRPRSYRDVDPSQVEALASRDALLGRRARHIVSETRRAQECAEALRRGDAARAGALMSASHASLRDDYEVSTGALDAAVAAATGVPGCRGARLAGAGFGGTAVALVEEGRAAACLRAMDAALPGATSRGSWVLQPAPGLAALAPDAVA
ncbi:MAG TPA: galactokinase family protein [Candidatus Dormibacteraeota bacterium]|jgi:galactokinase|nr:galactokinase family protein [Candidatus Dormibacteraeota bacterium]